MKKIDLSAVGRDDLDPGVEAALMRGERRSSLAHLTAKERKARAKEKTKAAARKGKQTLYDLDPAITSRIRDIAADLGTTNSQVAQLALALFLCEVDAGKINPADYKQAISHPRYLYVLKFPTITT